MAKLSLLSRCPSYVYNYMILKCIYDLYYTPVSLKYFSCNLAQFYSCWISDCCFLWNKRTERTGHCDFWYKVSLKNTQPNGPDHTKSRHAHSGILPLSNPPTLHHFADSPHGPSKSTSVWKSYAVLKQDLQVVSVRQVRNYSVTYWQRLDGHPNSLAKSLLQRTNYNRRLKRYYPADLATRF